MRLIRTLHTYTAYTKRVVGTVVEKMAAGIAGSCDHNIVQRFLTFCRTLTIPRLYIGICHQKIIIIILNYKL